MAIVLIAGCNETIRPKVTTWIMTSSDLEAADNPIVGRVGVNSDNVEAGLELNYVGRMERHSYGAYIIYELEQQIIGMTPYLGFHAVVAEETVGYDDFIHVVID